MTPTSSILAPLVTAWGTLTISVRSYDFNPVGSTLIQLEGEHRLRDCEQDADSRQIQTDKMMNQKENATLDYNFHRLHGRAIQTPQKFP